jgi:hypothetical protein
LAHSNKVRWATATMVSSCILVAAWISIAPTNGMVLDDAIGGDSRVFLPVAPQGILRWSAPSPLPTIAAPPTLTSTPSLTTPPTASPTLTSTSTPTPRVTASATITSTSRPTERASVGPQPAPDPRYANCRETISVDSGIDGEVDSTETIRYDLGGSITTDTLDEDADGKVELVAEYVYNDEGRWVRINRYTDDPTTASSFDHFEYDELGRLSYWNADDDANGVDDVVRHYEYEGRLLVRETLDSNADGRVDKVTRHSYDAFGRVTLSEFFFANDSLLNYSYRYDYSDGLLLRRDRIAANRVTEIVSYIYDSVGRLVREDIDDYADGSVDSFWLYYHDGSGRTEYYNGGDLQLRIVAEYDSAGRLIGVEIRDYVLGYSRRDGHDIDCIGHSRSNREIANTKDVPATAHAPAAPSAAPAWPGIRRGRSLPDRRAPGSPERS